MITPYGYDNAFLMLGVGVCLLILAFTLPGIVFPLLSGLLGTVLIGFTLWFFRDPERPLAEAARTDTAIVVSPADGTVTEIVALDHVAGIGGPATQVTIFLSPVNLHVNRYPVSGTVTDVSYIPGKYLMAFNPKASEENERSVISVATPHGPLIFKQITGFLARRVVYETKAGDTIKAGARFGMMKFGSRMDILVPEGTQINVRTGQKVVSNDTIIARLPATRGTAA